MALCPIHQIEFKLVPAGTSKSTGRPYNAFYACPTMGCREKPPLAPFVRPDNLPPKPAVVKEEGPDWDKITEGKVRHGIVIAMIESGKTKEEIFRETPMWVQYIMDGVPF